MKNQNSEQKRLNGLNLAKLRQIARACLQLDKP